MRSRRRCRRELVHGCTEEGDSGEPGGFPLRRVAPLVRHGGKSGAGMSTADDSGDGFGPEERIPRGWARHPRERMLITPLVAGVGGLLAFFTVVEIVVWLPIHTFDPPPSGDWSPLTDSALAGRNLFAQHGCFVCHSGYSLPHGVRL